MELIEQTVAANIRRLREERNVSLSELARRSSVAKATLSSLEAGTGNPTIQTLSALANALGCTLGDLIAQNGPQLLRDGDGAWVESAATRGRLVARMIGQRGVDVHEVFFKPGTTLEDRPLPGTSEHLYVVDGRLAAEVLGEAIELGPGDGIRFPADEAYALTAAGPGETKVLFFIAAVDVGPREFAGPTRRRRKQ